MRIVYEPRGRAREYADLACNLYIGCTHGCVYCFAPGCLHCTHADWSQRVYLRKRALELFERDAADLQRANDKRVILFSFLSDPYQPLEREYGVTHRALELIKHYGLRSQILTKGGADLISADLDLMKEAGTELGITVSFVDDKIRKRWEPHAAPIEERLAILKKAHERGVYTWVSLEPVIDTAQALEVIRAAVKYVDRWKIGKLNHMKGVEAESDWPKFREDVRALLHSYGKEEGPDFYIKHDLLTAR